MHGARDVGQSLRPVIDRIHRGDHRQQHLRGADVGGRLFAADVLLAGLQRQPIGRLAARIHRQPDEPAGQRALQRIAHRHIGRMRPAIAHRHAETLRRTDRDVGAEFARRGQQRQRQQIGGDNGERALGVQRRDRRTQVANRAGSARILQQRRRTRPRASRSVAGSPTIRFHPSGSARVRSTASVCGCTSASTKNDLVLAARGAFGQRHRFRRRGCLIEQRGVGDIEPGEIADHGLEVEQRFQPALADLRLIRRIGGVPGRILQDVALDHRRQNRAGIALADQRGEDLVLRGELAHMRERLGFAQSACRDRAALAAGSSRQRLRHQRRGFWRRRSPASRRRRAGRGRCGGARRSVAALVGRRFD